MPAADAPVKIPGGVTEALGKIAQNNVNDPAKKIIAATAAGAPEAEKKDGGEKSGAPMLGQEHAPPTLAQPQPKIGMGVTGQTVSSAFVPKEQQRALDEANANALTAQAKVTEQETAAAKRNEEAQKAEATRQAVEAAKAQAAEKQRQDLQQAEYAKSQAALDEVKKGKFKSADDYWKEKGVGAHIAGTIAIALGEIGSKLAGGPNTALKMIDTKIEQYIQKSKEEVAHTKDMAQLRHNQYAQLLQRGMSERQAEATMRAVGNEQATQALKAKLAEGGDKMAQASGKVVEAALQQRAAQHDAEIRKSIVQKTTGPTIDGMPAASWIAANKNKSGAANFDASLNAVDEMRARYKSGSPLAYSQALSRYAIPIAEGITGRPVRNLEQAISVVEDMAPGKLKQLFGSESGDEAWNQIEGMIKAKKTAGWQGGTGGGTAGAAEAD